MLSPTKWKKLEAVIPHLLQKKIEARAFSRTAPKWTNAKAYVGSPGRGKVEGVGERRVCAECVKDVLVGIHPYTEPKSRGEVTMMRNEWERWREWNMFECSADCWDERVNLGSMVFLRKLLKKINYRRVCCFILVSFCWYLCMISRMVRRVIAKRLCWWAEHLKQIEENQAGFRKRRSTTDVTKIIVPMQENLIDWNKRPDAHEEKNIWTKDLPTVDTLVTDSDKLSAVLIRFNIERKWVNIKIISFCLVIESVKKGKIQTQISKIF